MGGPAQPATRKEARTLAEVIALAHGPLSDNEALVMYATAVHGADHRDLPVITGLPEPAVQHALAQLVRRGLIQPHRKGVPIVQSTESETPYE